MGITYYFYNETKLIRDIKNDCHRLYVYYDDEKINIFKNIININNWSSNDIISAYPNDSGNIIQYVSGKIITKNNYI